MRIGSINPGPGGIGGPSDISGIGGAGNVRPTSNVAETAPSKDVISVSSTAQLVVAARDKIAEIPSVRAFLVEAIQKQFEANTYRPNADDTVDRLVQEHLRPNTNQL